MYRYSSCVIRSAKYRLIDRVHIHNTISIYTLVCQLMLISIASAIRKTQGKYNWRKSRNVITFPELGNESRSRKTEEFIGRVSNRLHICVPV